MATRVIERQRNKEGSYETIHRQTSADMVLMKDGQSVQGKLDGMGGGSSSPKAATIVIGIDGLHNKDNVDYLCDPDCPAEKIQLALESIHGTGRILLREGVYNLEHTLYFTSDKVHLCGMGNATVLRRAYASVGRDSNAFVTINNMECCISDIVIDGANLQSFEHRLNGVSLRKGFNRMYNTTIENFDGTGLALYSVSNMVTNSRFLGNSNYGMIIYASESTVTGNEINDGLYLYDSSERNMVMGNRCIAYHTPTIEPHYMSRYNMIAHNYLIGSEVSGDIHPSNEITDNMVYYY